MTDQQWQCLYGASNSLEAHSVKGLLENMGISVRLTGEALAAAAGELPMGVVEVQLWVTATQRQQALAIIESYLRNDYRDWYCRHCGELNQGQFELCWQCQHDSAE
ncbi:hypothetical protein AYY19_10090 [Photobacterium aquimaris]|uniref:DUF2007 domain-containing protein n=1 Tax=Photobacterium aquimaris TaxID=512643 RepID=A0A2T3IJQ6_9GAMM|nr:MULTISPECIES: DUF2007 domain-containing protein [Photobacterium]OBU09450.1 hypothetical protein AYY19_10090 [Photobacterium aquimaris]OBU13667.1 hypothetical protein AYY20_09470 [Photobacterium aquimaris]PSU28556.1 DUF2007 domain-containing protein [Photobacterium aquimaris]PSW01042.1 DUF2007 domain-containing protein [Photobacterium aquimaris]